MKVGSQSCDNPRGGRIDRSKTLEFRFDGRALEGYAGELAALRREGVTRALSDEALERIFALGFALDQLRLHLRDLARCVTEFAAARSVASSNMAASAGDAAR